jgi:hypothetical protein
MHGDTAVEDRIGVGAVELARNASPFGSRSDKVLQRLCQQSLLKLDRQQPPRKPADLIVRTVHGGRNVGGEFSRGRFGRGKHIRQGLGLHRPRILCRTDHAVEAQPGEQRPKQEHAGRAGP